MNSAMFQLNKIHRLISTQGKQFTFSRQRLNEYHEPNGQTESFTIKGVYHETTGYLSKRGTDAATIRSKSSPMLLCQWEEAQSLLHTDTLTFNGRVYKIGEIKNLAEANLIADISLEEVQA